MNIEKVLSKVSKAAQDAGRDINEILVLPVVKGQNEDVFETLRSAGYMSVGENHVQEFLTHYDSTKTAGFKWHFIGQLQTNKVKYIVGKCDLIQSLDRISLAQEIDKRSKQIGIITDCLIELNVISEPEKGGLKFDPDNIYESGKTAVDEFLDEIKDFKNLRIKGFMAVMPNEKDLCVLEKYYQSLGELFRYYKKHNGFNVLSAGMTNDFPTAIKYGATMIRLGRAIFSSQIALS